MHPSCGCGLVFLCAFSIAHSAEKSTTVAQKEKHDIVQNRQKYEMQDCNPAFHPAKMNCRMTAEILQNCGKAAQNSGYFAEAALLRCKRLQQHQRTSCIFAPSGCKNAPPGCKTCAGRQGIPKKFVKTGRNCDVIRQCRIHRRRRLQNNGAGRTVKIRPGR